MTSLVTTKPVSVTADTQIKGGAGYLNNIVINAVTTGGVLTIYDSLTETGTILYQFTLAISNTPIVIPVDGIFQTGLYVGFDATLVGRVTVNAA